MCHQLLMSQHRNRLLIPYRKHSLPTRYHHQIPPAKETRAQHAIEISNIRIEVSE